MNAFDFPTINEAYRGKEVIEAAYTYIATYTVGLEIHWTVKKRFTERLSNHKILLI